MSRKKMFFAMSCFVFAFFEIQALAQTNPDQATRIVPGFMVKGAYGPNPWRNTAFRNLPQSVRTVHYNDDVPYAGGRSPYTFDQETLKLHWGVIMMPLQLGPTLTIKNRLQLGAGGVLTIENNSSNQMKLGCYCVGSTVTYIEFRSTPIRLGGFGEVAVRLKGPVWLTTEASSSPMWSNISIRHAFSAYNSDDTLLKKHFGNYRVPLTALVGLKFCLDCNENQNGRGMFGFSGGYATWQNRVDSEFPDVRYPRNERHLVIQGFLEYNMFFGKKRNK